MAHYGRPPTRPSAGKRGPLATAKRAARVARGPSKGPLATAKIAARTGPKKGAFATAKIATRKAASAASGGIGPRVASRLGGRTPVKPKPRTGLAAPKSRGPTRTTQRRPR